MNQPSAHSLRSPSHRQSARRSLGAVAVLAFAAAACSPAGGSASPSPAAPTPAPTVRPSPTPIAATVASPEDAAAIVIATDPRFAEAMPLRADMIGASKYWTATPIADGGYRIELTLGWGDCPAGCIDKHVWTFDVQGDGEYVLVGESGPAVPADLPA